MTWSVNTSTTITSILSGFESIPCSIPCAGIRVLRRWLKELFPRHNFISRQFPNEFRKFFRRIKRRNVYKVAVAYIVAGWAFAQGIAQVFPVFGVPNWVIRLIVLLIIIGFPVALVLAWAFEITREGIKRTKDVDVTQPHSFGGAWIYIAILGALLSIGLFFLGRYTAREKRHCGAH